MVSRVLGKADIGVGSTPKHHIDAQRGKVKGRGAANRGQEARFRRR